MRPGAIAAAIALAATGTAAASPPLAPLTYPNCFDPTKPDADYEAYGPTDVNAQTGNGAVTAGENAAGTLTVFKYPNPSYYNQVKYFTLARDAAGRPQVQFPNDGSYWGLRWRTRRGRGFAWLRDWPSTQRYLSDDSPVATTTYRAPRQLGLSARAIDLAPPRTRSLVRLLHVRRTRGSPVRSVTAVYYENFNPVATRIQYFPISDWCVPTDSDQHAEWSAEAGAAVSSWAGTDQATGRPTSVAFAFGFDAPAAEHQVGEDGFDPNAAPGGPPDPYDSAARRLGDAGSADGQTVAALAQPLRFARGRVAAARVTIAGGEVPAAALGELAKRRSASPARQLAATRADWRRWLDGMLLPRTHDRRVLAVAKRSLISVRLATVAASGAIVASADTQGPYGEDWIRDGAFINHVLDVNGRHDAVTRHNLFYARVQTAAGNPSPLRPSGNWAMASYGDGVDGAPIPWEIDETGLGIWTLWEHAAFLPESQRGDYLRQVYPAIVRAADWLTQCEDILSGMQCPASEDDNYTPSQSLHGAETVYLGLQSAIAAAAAVGDTDARVAGWQARLARQRRAIDSLYDPNAHAYGEGNASGNGYNVVYGDGAWLLWPVRFKPYDDPAMQGEASAVRKAMDESLAAHQGEYEQKALLALAEAWRPATAEQRLELRRTLHYMATSLTTKTGLFGEAWKRYSSGRPMPVEDMPHVWEHCLFYLASLAVDGSERSRTSTASSASSRDE
ncbi:MAG: hypothetical protein ACJ76Z_11520 [Thermoleophilaceae bacterium]